MHWTDEAIVLGLRGLGEASAILDLMTATRGRQRGIVRGARSKRMAAVLQPGNRVLANWRARLDHQLGQFAIEPLALRAAVIMDRPIALFALQVMADHLRLLAEREAHDALYAAADAALTGFAALNEPDAGAIGMFMARFELALLMESGFGLDLSRCAVTGEVDHLAFVSPRSGRAVSRTAARGFEERLLPLPRFLLGLSGDNQPARALDEALRLTGFFLERHLYAPRNLREPAARRELIARLSRALAERSGED